MKLHLNVELSWAMAAIISVVIAPKHPWLRGALHKAHVMLLKTHRSVDLLSCDSGNVKCGIWDEQEEHLHERPPWMGLVINVGGIRNDFAHKTTHGFGFVLGPELFLTYEFHKLFVAQIQAYRVYFPNEKTMKLTDQTISTSIKSAVVDNINQQGKYSPFKLVLLTLAKPLDFATKTIKPICLPDKASIAISSHALEIPFYGIKQADPEENGEITLAIVNDRPSSEYHGDDSPDGPSVFLKLSVPKEASKETPEVTDVANGGPVTYQMKLNGVHLLEGMIGEYLLKVNTGYGEGTKYGYQKANTPDVRNWIAANAIEGPHCVYLLKE